MDVQRFGNLPEHITDIAEMYWRSSWAVNSSGNRVSIRHESEKPVPATVTRINPHYLGEMCTKCGRFCAFPTASNHTNQECLFYQQFYVEEK